MAKKKKEEAVVEEVKDTTQEQKVEETKIEKKEDLSKFESKDDPDVIKVDLSKPPPPKEEEVKEEVKEDAEEKVVEEVKEEVQAETKEQSEDQAPVIEEVTEEEQKEVEEVAEQVEEAVAESEATGKPLPENVQKLMDFMEETGGDLQDYVKLNRDYSKDSDMSVLHEYYKSTKPHLSSEEIDFLMEDQFSFEQDVDDEKEIRKKKIALKEQVADARAHLDRQKSKYYEEIKSGVKLTTEQQKAIDFFNKYNKESKETQKIAKANQDTFLKKTNQVFNNKFKGFEYNVGEKRYRFNVKNADEVKQTQSDINNFVKRFLNKNNAMEDATGYHKSLFTAMNADAIANHFYEQGKADAIKDTIAKGKNINTTARQAHTEVNTGGMKVRVLGEDSNDFKFKIKPKR